MTDMLASHPDDTVNQFQNVLQTVKAKRLLATCHLKDRSSGVLTPVIAQRFGRN